MRNTIRNNRIIRGIIDKVNNICMRYNINLNIRNILLAFVIEPIILFILSTCVLFFIRQHSKGNLTGIEQKKYIKSIIKKKLRLNKNQEISIEKYLYCNYVEDEEDNAIFVYGSYCEKINKWDGRYIAILERKDESIFNAAFGTEPGYRVKYLSINTCGLNEDKLHLYCDKVDSEDIDNDGIKENIITLRSNFADRISVYSIIMSRNENKWDICTIDKEKIVNNISKVVKKEKCKVGMIDHEEIKEKYDILIGCDRDVFWNLDNKKKYSIYGLYKRGGGFILDNAINGKKDFCYKFDCGWQGKFDFIYLMLRYEKGKFIIEPNWNAGNALLKDEEYDFEMNYNNLWGKLGKIDGYIFYSKE